MAAPTNTSVTGEIWQLSIDDLLAPLPETVRLGGPGPFVINLSASSAPIGLPDNCIAGCQHAHVYQVKRTEDRRVRYRLRLGPFAQEDEADAVLMKVRDIYPGALTATADAEDLRAIAAAQAKAQELQSAAEIPSAPAEKPPMLAETPTTPGNSSPQLAVAKAAVPTPRISSRPSAAAKPAVSPPRNSPSQPAAKPAVSPVPAAISPPVLTSEQRFPVQGPAAAAARAPVSPMPAAISPPVLTSEQRFPVQGPAAASAKAAVSPVPPATSPPRLTSERRHPGRVPVAARTPNASAPRQAEHVDQCLPSLETTQTVRAITQVELEDDHALRWYVIQLSSAQEAFDPDTVPNLDIFSVYRLYSVAGIDQGRIVHALRLGFFREEAAASAVASYLAAFYEKPTIKRVSAAERQRFAEQPLEPRKDMGATGKQAVIEITDERFVRRRRSDAV
jgi:hypothetical protein